MLKKILLCIMLLVIPSVAAIKEASSTPPFRLSLDEVKQGTTTTGVANLQVLVNLQPPNKVQFTLPSGEVVLGLVTSSEVSETEKSVRIYGDCLNVKNAGFGFVFTNKADIAGAIVFREQKKTYVLRYNEAIKGYIFNLEYPKDTTN